MCNPPGRDGVPGLFPPTRTESSVLSTKKATFRWRSAGGRQYHRPTGPPNRAGRPANKVVKQPFLHPLAVARRGPPVPPGGVCPMVPEVELLLRVVLLWMGLPAALVVLAIGPRRAWNGVKKAWSWLWTRRLEPEEALNQVVQG